MESLIDFRLKVFATVARELSFTKAARALNISQPAVTKQIKELEKSVATALFLRAGSQIHLTAKALELLPFVKAILDRYEELNLQISQETHSYVGELRIGASTTIAQYILPALLAKFSQKYREIKLSVSSGNSEEIARKVMNDEVDIALVEGAETHPALHYEAFANDEIILVTAQKGKRSITLEQLPLLPLVIRENGSGTLAVLERALHKIHIERKQLHIVMQLGSSEGILRYLRYTPSYAFISIAAARDYLNEQKIERIKILDFSIARTLRFVTLHGPKTHLAELFQHFCLAHYPAV